jgi:hypothetical protein
MSMIRYHYKHFEYIIKSAQLELDMLALPVDVTDSIQERLKQIVKDVIDATETMCNKETNNE